MTGKRFTLIYGIDENPFEWDIMDNEKDTLICRCNGTPICDLLNELYEENQKLEVQLVTCLNTKLFSRRELEKENKEFKEENQHIKNTIKEAYNNERTQLGKSVLKQLMEEIQ
jgi:hypothetical protein